MKIFIYYSIKNIRFSIHGHTLQQTLTKTPEYTSYLRIACILNYPTSSLSILYKAFTEGNATTTTFMNLKPNTSQPKGIFIFAIKALSISENRF
ncbi:MAG: hypothetical protein ACK40G_11220 [Cytophagaceae bacterium]